MYSFYSLLAETVYNSIKGSFGREGGDFIYYQVSCYQPPDDDAQYTKYDNQHPLSFCTFMCGFGVTLCKNITLHKLHENYFIYCQISDYDAHCTIHTSPCKKRKNESFTVDSAV